ncbi:MAG TPA: hypothetical protein VE291_09165 [Terracidiphilus sp.]|jgi:hypothetical protein|nr:hypothetical protein [Terracidiphilus sp.]
MPLPLAQTGVRGRTNVGARPRHLPAPLRLWHLASLDAPTVAVVWALAFAHAAGVHLPAWVPALLALGAWAVYIGDRLLDARSGLGTGNLHQLRDRHFFHWRHRRILAPVAVLAACAAMAIIVTLMPAAIRTRNSVLAAAALVYFSGVHLPRRPRWLARVASKELLVGILFTTGCVFPTLTRLHGTSLAPIAAAVFFAAHFFAALAWLNCYAIDRWESAPSATVAPHAQILAAAALVAACALASMQPRIAALLASAAASAALLALLDRRRARLTPLALRAAADLVLLTPLALLLPFAPLK